MVARALQCLSVLAVLSAPVSALAAYGDTPRELTRLAGLTESSGWGPPSEPVRAIVETAPCGRGAVAVFSRSAGGYWCAPIK